MCVWCVSVEGVIAYIVHEEVTMLAWLGDVGLYVLRLKRCPIIFAFLSQ